MKKFIALAAAVSVIGATQFASAATFTLTPVVNGSFQTDFTPIAGPADTTTQNGVARIFQVDFHIGTANLLPGERGFGNVGFTIVNSPGLTDAAGGWQPSTEQTDSNGAAPGGIVPLYSTNADAGPSNSDLVGIFATIAGGISSPNASDARVKIGQGGGPSFVGSIFVQWDALAPATTSVTAPIFSTYLNDGTFIASAGGTGGAVTFGGAEIPEPATVALAGMALVGLIAVRRRKA